MPLIDSTQVRPRRGWYAPAAVLPVLGIIAGVIAFVFGLWASAGVRPAVAVESAGGAESSASLLRSKSYMMYVPRGTAPVPSCTVTPATSADVTPLRGDIFSYRSGSMRWEAQYQLRVTGSGDYTINCDGTPFAVADATRTANAAAFGTLGALGGLLGLPCVGLVAGFVAWLVVFLRRRGSRKRLELAVAHQPYGWSSTRR
jgi:hypothetical protein